MMLHEDWVDDGPTGSGSGKRLMAIELFFGWGQRWQWSFDGRWLCVGPLRMSWWGHRE